MRVRCMHLLTRGLSLASYSCVAELQDSFGKCGTFVGTVPYMSPVSPTPTPAPIPSPTPTPTPTPTPYPYPYPYPYP